MPAGPRKSSRGLAALGRSRRPEAGRGQIGFVRAIWGRGEQWAAGAGGRQLGSGRRGGSGGSEGSGAAGQWCAGRGRGAGSGYWERAGRGQRG